MNNSKYLFVGNRKFVLEEMIKNGLDIKKILVIDGSYLQKDILDLNIDYEIVHSKKQLIESIEKTNFDILISNGCPYILPISELDQSKAYINIHPSYLPDLRGIDPVIGSILHYRDSGATCHFMNDGIDSGDIIAQIKIPITKDLDVSLLYQLSFIAEQKVFKKALQQEFKAAKKQGSSSGIIYYSRQEGDKRIRFSDSIDEILQKIKAFNNRSQGAYFQVNGLRFKVFSGEVLNNEFLKSVTQDWDEYRIIFAYENSVLFKKEGKIIKFSNIEGHFSKLKVNVSLI